MKNSLNWFEIPVTDLERGVGYYEEVLDVSLVRWAAGDVNMAMFPYDQQGQGVGGAIVQRGKPAAEGTIVYLNAAGKLDACVERATARGGSVLQPKLDIGDPGFIALIKDPDGNVVGLHAPR